MYEEDDLARSIDDILNDNDLGNTSKSRKTKPNGPSQEKRGKPIRTKRVDYHENDEFTRYDQVSIENEQNGTSQPLPRARKKKKKVLQRAAGDSEDGDNRLDYWSGDDRILDVLRTTKSRVIMDDTGDEELNQTVKRAKKKKKRKTLVAALDYDGVGKEEGGGIDDGLTIVQPKLIADQVKVQSDTNEGSEMEDRRSAKIGSSRFRPGSGHRPGSAGLRPGSAGGPRRTDDDLLVRRGVRSSLQVPLSRGYGDATQTHTSTNDLENSSARGHTHVTRDEDDEEVLRTERLDDDARKSAKLQLVNLIAGDEGAEEGEEGVRVKKKKRRKKKMVEQPEEEVEEKSDREEARREKSGKDISRRAEDGKERTGKGKKSKAKYESEEEENQKLSNSDVELNNYKMNGMQGSQRSKKSGKSSNEGSMRGKKAKGGVLDDARGDDVEENGGSESEEVLVVRKGKKKRKGRKNQLQEDGERDEEVSGDGVVEYTPVVVLGKEESESEEEQQEQRLNNKYSTAQNVPEIIEPVSPPDSPPAVRPVHRSHHWNHPESDGSANDEATPKFKQKHVSPKHKKSAAKLQPKQDVASEQSSSESDGSIGAKKPPKNPSPSSRASRSRDKFSARNDRPKSVMSERISFDFNSDTLSDAEFEGIFSIEGYSYDVYFKKEGISWASVSKIKKVPKMRKKKLRDRIGSSSLTRRGSTASLNTCELDEVNSLPFEEIFGVDYEYPLRRKTSTAGSTLESAGGEFDEDMPKARPTGLKLFYYDTKDGNRLKNRSMVLEHPSTTEIAKWVVGIRLRLREFPARPRHLKVFLQPFAGKCTRHTFQNRIFPLLKAAQITVDISEIAHNEYVHQQFQHIELEKFDSIVAVGGDTTVATVASEVLTKYQTEIRPHFTPLRPALAVGIVPTGKCNQICHSLTGTDDPITAALYIILGQRMSVDVCSVFEEDEEEDMTKFIGWSFGAHYGFFGTFLQHLEKSNFFGEVKEEAGILKALKKKYFRSFELEISYRPVKGKAKKNKQGKVCYTDCTECGRLMDTKHVDHVENLSAKELADTTSEWVTFKGHVLNVSVLSLTGRHHYAPWGMSPYAHLGNGTLDLIIVKETGRKNFVRYLRRHGNQKDQFDLPYVEIHRCTEVKVHLRSALTWRKKDYTYNELEDRAAKNSPQLGSTSDVQVVDDLNTSSDEEEDAVIKDALNAITSQGQSENPSDADDDQVDSCAESLDDDQQPKKGKERKRRISKLFQVTEATGDGYYQPTDYVANETEKRKAKKQNKDEKRWRKMQGRSRTLWNMDMVKHPPGNFVFTVHKGLAIFHASGIPRTTTIKNVGMPCLTLFK